MTWIKDHQRLVITVAAIIMLVLLYYILAKGAFGIGTGGVTGDQGPSSGP